MTRGRPGPVRVWALPSTLVLSRNGVPLFVLHGAWDWDGPAAHTLFDSLLKRDP